MKLTKMFKNKLLYLIVGIFLNVLAIIFSLSLPSSVDKFSYSPLNFLGEFFTVNWCVGNSVFTVIYNLDEIKNDYQKIDIAKKKQRDFGLLMAVSNLVVMVVFTATLILKKELLPADRNVFGGTNSIIWHYIAPLIFLIYFFKFVKLKKFDFKQKKLFWIIFPLPIIFFLANLVRRFLANPEFLGGKLKFKKFLLTPFEGAEQGKFTLLALFVIFTLLGFWLFACLLLKAKRYYFPKTIKPIKNKELSLLTENKPTYD